MSFIIQGLDPSQFLHLYGATEEELAAANAVRMTADSTPGFPDRIEMRDADPGETVLLLNFCHQPATSPYRSSHAIFVREGATLRYESDEIPDVMRRRVLSVRSFDAGGFMTGAELTDGLAADEVFKRLLDQPATVYLHVHNAVRGCYSGLVLPG